ncbi:MAG: hypothetical protein ACXITV_03255 [Luteibaculaceae bacterium]
MTKDKKKIQKTDVAIFRVFELLTESIGWLQIVASPLLIGIILGAIIYFPNPTTKKLVFGIIIATLGLLIGIIWATKQWKGKGTIWLMSRIMATPELDNLDEDKTKTVIKKDDKQKGNR